MPGLAEQPAVIGATQAALVRNAILQVDATVEAAIADEAEAAARVAIEDEILAENAHLADGVFRQLHDGSDRDPVAPHQLAAGRAGSDTRQPVIHCFAEHRPSSSCVFRLLSRLLAVLCRTRHDGRTETRGDCAVLTKLGVGRIFCQSDYFLLDRTSR